MSASTPAQRRRTAPTVLVVDDSATVRAVVAAELEAGGYHVLLAADGRAALDAARSERVDVVLLDVEMPEMDGWAVVQELKADPATKGIAVVFLTGRSATADAVQALELGAHDFVRKPPQPAELLARVAAAVRTKQAQDALRSRADRLDVQGRTDGLTGVRNRRHAEQHLDAAVRMGSRDDRPLALLLLDIDAFKDVNDAHGHAAGDRVLRDIADRLRGAVRADDLVARWGGEEFLVVSRADDPADAADDAATLAQRLLAAIASPPLRPAPGAPGVTVSIGGVGGVLPDDSSAADLLAVADRNLYRAKTEGRDRAVVTGLLGD